MKTILLVEDDPGITRLNRGLFEGAGYRVKEANSLSQAAWVLNEETPDLIVLDVMLPDGNGVDFCHSLRSESDKPPILFLSVKKQAPEIVEGFRAGGDGYLPKPYDIDVLLANAEALIRRSEQIVPRLIKGGLELDLVSDAAYLYGEDMMLTQKEFALLLLFAQTPGKAMSPEYLYERVWKKPMIDDDCAVKNTVYRLRKKLKPTGMDIVFQRNKGYIFIAEGE